MIRNDDLGYPIVVAQCVRDSLHQFLEQRAVKEVVVLCDDNVAQIAHFLTKGIRGRAAVRSLTLGERRKSFEGVRAVASELASAGAQRDTLVIGVGGGVASDLFGFAAATYMRGVDYIHVATTLLAMVDAAIGGKTGINLVQGKNLVGSFCDPLAVFCHVDALRSLPNRFLREGLAEMVKHAIIEGNEAFESLETLAAHPFSKWPWEVVIADSIKVKTMIVNDDRVERGCRETLNLGHTFGHAIELASHHRISHGAALSVGLRAAGLLALRTGRFSKAEHLRVLTLLTLLKMPLRTRESVVNIIACMGSDKKKREGKLRFVLPRAIGDVEFGINVPKVKVRAVTQRCTGDLGPSEFVTANR